MVEKKSLRGMTTEITDASPAGIEESSSTCKGEQRSVEGEAFDGGNLRKVAVPLDGYSWKKYGQKFIKSIGKYRSYFKCQNANCKVKKRVEWSSSDPHNNVRVIYDGVHSHGSSSSISKQETTAEQESASTDQYNLFTQVFGTDQESDSVRHHTI